MGMVPLSDLSSGKWELAQFTDKATKACLSWDIQLESRLREKDGKVEMQSVVPSVPSWGHSGNLASLDQHKRHWGNSARLSAPYLPQPIQMPPPPFQALSASNKPIIQG